MSTQSTDRSPRRQANRFEVTGRDRPAGGTIDTALARNRAFAAAGGHEGAVVLRRLGLREGSGIAAPGPNYWRKGDLTAVLTPLQRWPPAALLLLLVAGAEQKGDQTGAGGTAQAWWMCRQGSPSAASLVVPKPRVPRRHSDALSC